MRTQPTLPIQLSLGACLKAVGVLVGFLLPVVLLSGCRGAQPAALCRDCNILLISMDTLRADHLGCYGYEQQTSPNIDRLAERSVVFERAVSQSAWTRPAHASMLTGLYPVEHGIVAMSRNGGLNPSIPTLAGILSHAGYRTGAFTGGANMSAHFGFGQGFESYRSPGRRFEDHLPAIERWLDRDDGRPWFLFVHGFDPHRPYKSLPADRKALGLPRLPARGARTTCKTGGDPAALAPLVAEYDAAVHRGDRSIGRLLEIVGARGGSEKTIVVFTSDHGEEFLEHGRCFHIRTLYREVVQVPLIVSVPGISARRVDQVVPASAAITPTLLELVGHRKPRQPGPSIAAALSGDRADVGEVVSETSSRYVESKGHGHGHVRALTTDDDKLIDWIAQGRREYYDIRADSLETKPVTNSPRIAVLSRRLERWLESHPPLDLEATDAVLPERLRNQLRRMGYID
jgi:arylsulfatase A-like enzyme